MGCSYDVYDHLHKASLDPPFQCLQQDSNRRPQNGTSKSSLVWLYSFPCGILKVKQVLRSRVIESLGRRLLKVIGTKCNDFASDKPAIRTKLFSLVGAAYNDLKSCLIKI